MRSEMPSLADVGKVHSDEATFECSVVKSQVEVRAGFPLGRFGELGGMA